MNSPAAEERVKRIPRVMRRRESRTAIKCQMQEANNLGWSQPEKSDRDFIDEN